MRRKSEAGDAVFGEHPITGSYFTCLFNGCLAGRQERQFVVRCFQQRASQHAEKFRRCIHRQVESFARDNFLALFAAILPSRPAVFYFEMLFDRCLHVIVAMAVVFCRHASAVEFPTRGDVIAATAIVVGVFSAHCAVRLELHGLCAGRVTLNDNFVGAMLRHHVPARGSQYLVGKQNERDNSDANDKPGKLAFAPVGKGLARRNVRRAFHSLRRHFEGPRDENRDNEPERD